MIGLIFLQKECNWREYRTTGTSESTVKIVVFMCCRFMRDHTAECCTVAIRGPEPPAGARGLLQTATSCERVSTFCNRKCDHGVHPATDAKQKKKCFGGWNVMWTVGFNHWTPQGCYRLPSMLLKAKGSFRLGFAVIRPGGVSDHNFQGPPRRSKFVRVNL